MSDPTEVDEMVTSQPAGWYPDPSGMPDTFRWWDGMRWTQALSPRADAPPPPNPKPVVSEDPEAAHPPVPAPSATSAENQPTENRPTDSTQTSDDSGASRSGDAPRSGDKPARDEAAGDQPSGDQPATDDSAGEGSAGASGDQHEHAAEAGSRGTAKQGSEGHQAEGGASERREAAGANQSEGREQSAVPPPAGAPGPEYLPPQEPPADRTASSAEATSPSDGGEPRRQNLRSVVALTTVLVLLAGVAVAAWFWWPRPDDSQVATPPPQQVPSGPNEPSPSPTPSSQQPSPQNPSPSPSEDDQPSESARLVFEPLKGDWKESPRFGLLSDGYAETQVTQADFDGRNDWIALVTTGIAPPDAQQGSLDQQAKAVANWFRRVGFHPMRVKVEEVDSENVTVDGRPAHLLVQRISYDNPSLRSRSDLVTVVVVDMGEQNPPGVFLGSVPNTHEKLTVDVDNARRSLRIAE